MSNEAFLPAALLDLGRIAEAGPGLLFYSTGSEGGRWLIAEAADGSRVSVGLDPHHSGLFNFWPTKGDRARGAGVLSPRLVVDPESRKDFSGVY